jgi:phage FluMu protein Com
MKVQQLSGKKSVEGQGKSASHPVSITTCFMCDRELTRRQGTGVVYVECAYCKVIWDYYYQRRKDDHGL